MTHRVELSYNSNELKCIDAQLNKFLKKHFTLKIVSVIQYVNQVKKLLINMATKKSTTTIMSGIISKLGNVLQPLLKIETSDQIVDKLNENLDINKEKCEKMKKKIKRIKQQMQVYKQKSMKLMNFIYNLRCNNIDVDSLFIKITQHNQEFDQSIASKTNRKKFEQIQPFSENLTLQFQKKQSKRFQEQFHPLNPYNNLKIS